VLIACARLLTGATCHQVSLNWPSRLRSSTHSLGSAILPCGRSHDSHTASCLCNASSALTVAHMRGASGPCIALRIARGAGGGFAGPSTEHVLPEMAVAGQALVGQSFQMQIAFPLADALCCMLLQRDSGVCSSLLHLGCGVPDRQWGPVPRVSCFCLRLLMYSFVRGERACPGRCICSCFAVHRDKLMGVKP
jgi:hypothetical protein